MTPARLERVYSAHSNLTSVHPYVAFDATDELTLWGQGGYGRGSMALTESLAVDTASAPSGSWRTGSSIRMVAGGARGELPELAGFDFAIESDAFFVRTSSAALTGSPSGNLAAGSAGAGRVRAALQGSRSLTFGLRSFTPSLQIGVRQDSGDAETGAGLEGGFGLAYLDPAFGLTVDLNVQMLLVHQDSRYDEWRFSGAVRFDPGTAGRGLSLNVTPSFGAASQGADRLWAMQDMGRLMPYGGMPLDMGGQFAADLGYGMAGPGGRGTGTPYAGVTQNGLPGDPLRMALGGRPAVQPRHRGQQARRGRRTWGLRPSREYR